MSESALVALRGASFAHEDGPPVLSGLDFEVRGGRALALLGRNGSGKTTLMRLLSGGLRPHTGELILAGEPVRYDRAGLTRLRTAVQLVVQDPDDQLFAASVGQDVSFGPLNLGLSDAEVRGRVAEALAALDITALADRPTHLLSYGQRKRAAIAGAVAMRPRVLILDEPTAGLDPLMEAVFADVIAEEHAAGRTVLLSSHTLAQVEKLCERISIIRRGVVVESGSLAEMRHLTRTTVDAVTERPVDLTGLTGVHDLTESRGNRLRLDVDSEHLDALVGRLHAAGIRSLVSHPPTLEQLFMRHYGEDVAELEGAAAAVGGHRGDGEARR